MPFGEAKVYFDSSHYIAIPHTTNPYKRRPQKQEEIITVNQEEIKDSGKISEPSISIINSYEENIDNISVDENTETKPNIETKESTKTEKKLTKKELFNELYSKYIDNPRKKRQKLIYKDMLPYFSKPEHCESYVQIHMERKQRNLICRRVRMVRKANLVDFNYFCTFTYDDKLHTEQSFKKKLQGCFKMMCHRKGWKYMGVWERAPKTKRLHFHGLFAIPKDKMVGELFEHSDYSFSAHRRTKTIQNTYFNERFGRTDFEEINTHADLMKEISYICKYLEKTEEKIVYSKGLYQYFISDIMDDDIICTIGQEDKKLLLFDDFKCFDEGEYKGKVSTETIAQMRKCN